MDEQKQVAQPWPESQFAKTDAEGIYIAQQPIYGFRQGPSEPGAIGRYITTYQIMNSLSHLAFSSLLEIGGGEGYRAALARSLFGVDVRSADSSAEACKLASEIFKIPSDPIAMNQLPYEDGAFDVVLCNASLECVSELEKVTEELLRVCRKALVMTVPRGAASDTAQDFDENSFDFARAKVSRIICNKSRSPLLTWATAAAERPAQEAGSPLAPLWERVFTRERVEKLIQLDKNLANKLPLYGEMTFLLLKDENCYAATRRKVISPGQILDFAVPYYRL